MRVKIEPSRALGAVLAPPSKSIAHRLIICAALASGTSVIDGISLSSDVLATLDCISSLGVNYELNGRCVKIYGKGFEALSPNSPLMCRESGSTIRFFIPILLALGKDGVFKGASSLLSRPMTVYEDICKSQGISFVKSDNSITVDGKLAAGNITLPGNVSSQFISGLLFALPLLPGDSRIQITAPIESRSYIELTRSALSEFGIATEWEDESTIYVKGGQRYSPRNLSVEGDYSGAAFLDAFNLFDGEVKILGLNPESAQGDAVYREYFKALDSGAPTLDLSDCPDLAPITFAVAAAKNGAVFTGTKRLKIKESDRVTAMAAELIKLGATVIEADNSVTVISSALHAPNEPIHSHNDHRIVMSLAVLLSRLGGEIEGAEAVAKSYPEFFDDIAALGIKVTKNDT